MKCWAEAPACILGSSIVLLTLFDSHDLSSCWLALQLPRGGLLLSPVLLHSHKAQIICFQQGHQHHPRQVHCPALRPLYRWKPLPSLVLETPPLSFLVLLHVGLVLLSAWHQPQYLTLNVGAAGATWAFASSPKVGSSVPTIWTTPGKLTTSFTAHVASFLGSLPAVSSWWPEGPSLSTLLSLTCFFFWIFPIHIWHLKEGPLYSLGLCPQDVLVQCLTQKNHENKWVMSRKAFVGTISFKTKKVGTEDPHFTGEQSEAGWKLNTCSWMIRWLDFVSGYSVLPLRRPLWGQAC